MFNAVEEKFNQPPTTPVTPVKDVALINVAGLKAVELDVKGKVVIVKSPEGDETLVMDI